MTPEAQVRTRFEDRAAVQLRKKHLPLVIGRATDAREARRRDAFARVDAPALRAEAARIREETLARLDEHLERFAAAAEARGTRVFFAATAGEAVDYVRGVLARRGARTVVKGKSMAAEEIGLNHALEADGLDVFETDLGEYIVQLAGEPPSHITAPAVHKSRDEIAKLLSADAGRSLPSDPEVLTGVAREVLRERFLRADAGISGVNFAIADTGSFVMVTNEGNGRMASSLPPVHIAIMGMERIVPSHRELDVLLPMLVTSASGRAVTTYFSFVNGPRRAGEPDGPEELHVVVLDNGRSRILGTEYRSILRCIRCGACQNVCPVYRQTGGHAYGSVYGGPIGAVLTPLLVGFERAGDLPNASSLCGACTEVCPVEIPLHEQLIALRRDVVAAERPVAEATAFRMWAAFWRRPSGFRLFIRASRLGQRVFVRRGRIRHAPLFLGRWTRARDLPPIAKRTFRERWTVRPRGDARPQGDG